MAIFGTARWDPRGKHCYVTGGSSGTGAALAVLLAKQGAHVSIVARNEERLAQVTQEMEAARQSKDQRFHWYSYSLSTSSGSEAALKAASEPFGGACPEAVFLCAGFSKPGFFIEQDEESMMNGMDSTYWVQAWSALAVAKTMVRQDVKGKIAFMSSVLGYMSIVGYSTYSPGKHALRGLAETLRSELQLYDISVHIQFPGTIQGASLEEEKKTKPKITLKIEETDVGAPSEAIAKSFLEGVKKGDFHITVDFITDVFRSTTRGSSPFGSIFDLGYEFIGTIALLFWRRSVDSTIRNHRDEHRQYLRERGLIDDSTATK